MPFRACLCRCPRTFDHGAADVCGGWLLSPAMPGRIDSTINSLTREMRYQSTVLDTVPVKFLALQTCFGRVVRPLGTLLVFARPCSRPRRESQFAGCIRQRHTNALSTVVRWRLSRKVPSSRLADVGVRQVNKPPFSNGLRPARLHVPVIVTNALHPVSQNSSRRRSLTHIYSVEKSYVFSE